MNDNTLTFRYYDSDKSSNMTTVGQAWLERPTKTKRLYWTKGESETNHNCWIHFGVNQNKNDNIQRIEFMMPNIIEHCTFSLRGSINDDVLENNYDICNSGKQKYSKWGETVTILYYPETYAKDWPYKDENNAQKLIFWNLKNNKPRLHVPYGSRFWLCIKPDPEKIQSGKAEFNLTGIPSFINLIDINASPEWIIEVS
jgi:hypothetical protein